MYPLSAKSFPKSLSVKRLSFSGALSSTLPGVSCHCMGKFLAHMLADGAEVEGLEVAEMHGVEQHQYRHHLAVGKTARTVATPLA